MDGRIGSPPEVEIVDPVHDALRSKGEYRMDITQENQWGSVICALEMH